ncbi:MAG: replication protein RepB [Candidatus Midichloriaceae bacterium]|jgi:plasmid replication initiation protein|nr:replication protein RepB [Candidatus Midichloriaceae bacterium]
MAEEQNNYLIKHTAAIHVDNDMTVVERKLINVLLKQSRASMLTHNIHTISMKQLMGYLGSDQYSNYSYIKDSLHNLVKRTMRFNILKKDRKLNWEASISFLSEVHFQGGMIFYAFSPTLVDILAKPNLYANLNLSYLKCLSSKHSLALWEFCCEHLDTLKLDHSVTPPISVQALRDLLGASAKSYDDFKMFNVKILKRAIEEINASTDIVVTMHVKERKGRSVSSLVFEVKRNAPKVYVHDAGPQLVMYEDDVITLINKTLSQQDLEMNAQAIGIDKESLDKFLKKHELKYVDNAVNYIDKQQKNGTKITNVGGYLWKLLDNGLVEIESQEESFTEQRKSRLYDAIMKYNNLSERDNKFFKVFADLHEDIFTNWISQTEFVNYQNGILYLKARSDFFREWITTNYTAQINSIGAKVYEDYEGFEVVL